LFSHCKFLETPAVSGDDVKAARSMVIFRW